ncbi:hypothetical protein QW71_18910 [Paenibacillus sp. IHB B 3415]|uniref:hypothetical protein n=1 Tax=Paenibacillus sp. IHB B 3415 TaxID=867080 RepID=UPI00057320C8|nr:hypothetical protein [Paenibacillus sp. IHB B 3415]KHL94270.1 hypothetical protein QW71_18910 [Paenibacillus sp. IHB B 3415]
MVFEKIKAIIEDIGIEEEITEASRLYEDLALDSTELALVSTGLAKAFGIFIEGKELRAYSVGQVIEAVALKA